MPGGGESAGPIPEWLRFADPLQSKVAALVCHSGRSAGGLGGGAVHRPPTQQLTLRLLYAASAHDADILYPTGFFAPDPFLCLIAGSRTILVMSDLEMDRAKRESKATQVWSWAQMAKRAGVGAPPPRVEHVIAACLKRLGARTAEVPGSFPLGLARKLEGLNVRLRVARDPFWPEREIKTRNEVKKVEASLRAAEAGLLAGIEALKSTRIGRDGWLRLGGSKFTSEDLRGVVDTTILKLGGTPRGTICAGGDQAVDPHEMGHGPLRAHSPIVMDIFPRSQSSGYFGDLSRTVVRGLASETLKEVYALVEEGKQIVISADKSPADLEGIENRLSTRLGCGMVADIHATTFELRMGILESKASRAGVAIPDKVLEFLAHKIDTNVRELEGCLNRLVAHASLFNRPITPESAQTVLHDILRSHDRRVTIEEIQKRVAEHWGLRITDMTSSRRARTVARPRQVAMYLAKQFTDRSLPEIGRMFGNRDHTTVMHAIGRVTELMAGDPEFKESVELMANLLKR